MCGNELHKFFILLVVNSAHFCSYVSSTQPTGTAHVLIWSYFILVVVNSKGGFK